MLASHVSLRDDFEVSCAELDTAEHDLRHVGRRIALGRGARRWWEPPAGRPLSPKPRWSNDSTPKPASSHLANAAASLVREPPQPWLCMIIGTLRCLLAPAGRNSV